MSVSIKEKLLESKEYANKAINATSKEEYKENVKKLLDVYPIIDDAVVASLLTNDSFAMISNIASLIKIEYDTSLKEPFLVTFIKSRHVLKINPLFIHADTFAERIGMHLLAMSEYVFESTKFVKAKITADRSNKSVASALRANAVVANDIVRDDMIVEKNQSRYLKLKMPEYAYSAADYKLECDGARIPVITQDNLYDYGMKNLKLDTSGLDTNGVIGNNGTSTAQVLNAIEKFEDFPVDAATELLDDLTDSDINAIQEDLKYTIKTAHDNLNDKQRGLMPGQFKERITRMFLKQEQIKWQKYLNASLSGYPISVRNTRKRINRRKQFRLDVPGKITAYGPKVTGILDSSGSMSMSEKKAAINEMWAIVNKYGGKLKIIQCDTEVNSVVEIKSKKDITELDLVGGGGTIFSPALDYVSTHLNDSIVIYFTDGWGEYNIKKPRCTKLMWVITRTKTVKAAKNTLSVKNPYGIVLPLNDENTEE